MTSIPIPAAFRRYLFTKRDVVVLKACSAQSAQIIINQWLKEGAVERASQEGRRGPQMYRTI